MSSDALFQLGMDLEARHHEGADASFADAYAFDVPRSTTHTEDNDTTAPAANTQDDRLDHFIEREGVRCAGSHLIIDLYDASRLDDLPFIEETLKTCVTEAGATLALPPEEVLNLIARHRCAPVRPFYSPPAPSAAEAVGWRIAA